jgi:quinol monooxygenase YgiN
MVHVIATIRLKAGRRDEFLAILRANVPNVRGEDGCIRYEPAVDVDSGLSAQGPLRQDVVVILEQWKSLEHLHRHLAAPHMQVYRQQVRDLVEGVELQVMEAA